MKNLTILSIVLALSLTACQKEGNKAVLKNDNIENGIDQRQTLFDESKTYAYLASDGSRANVNYQNDEDSHTIIINANNKKFVLDEKDGDADSQLYERNGVEAKLTRDSLFITQDETVIPLALIK